MDDRPSGYGDDEQDDADDEEQQTFLPLGSRASLPRREEVRSIRLLGLLLARRLFLLLA